MNSSKLLQEIVGEALKSGTFQIVPNFDAAHGKKYIHLMLQHLIDKNQTNTDFNFKFYLYTHNLIEDVYDKSNIDLMVQLNEVGGDVKCILWEESQNPNYRAVKDFSKIIPNAKSISSIEDKFIVINNSFANELRDPVQPHKAQFYFNIDKADYKNNLKQRGIFIRYHTLNKAFEELWLQN